MTRRRYPLPIAALACVALLAGCGSSSSNSTSTASSSPAAQTGSTAAKSTPTPAVPKGSAEVKAATAECKQIIQQESKLPSGAKSKLEGACSKAAEGDTNAVKVAAREVCEEVIDKSQVPNGTSKEEALKACRK